MKRCVTRGTKPLEGCQLTAIHCQFSSRSSVAVLPYFVMNQLNMRRKTVFGCFIRIGSYVSQIAFGRFVRTTSDRAAFMVTMSALVFWSQVLVAFGVLCALSELHAEKSGIESTSSRNGKKSVGYALFMKNE